jgi:hypothetical protein
MAAMFVTAVGSFQSCKDYDGDITDLQQNVTPLKDQVTSLESALASVKIDLAAAQSRADKAVEDAEFAAKNAVDVNELSQKVSDALEAIAELSKLKSEAASLEDAITATNDLIAGKVDKKAYDEKVAEIAGQINAIDEKLNKLTEGLASTATLKTEVDDAKKEAREAIASLKADLAGQIEALEIFQEDVNSRLAEVKAVLGSSEDATLGNVLEQVATRVVAAEKATNELKDKVAAIDVNAKAISEIRTSLEGLQTSINGAVEKCDQVNRNISALNVFVDNALTSLVLKPTLYYGGIEAVEAIHGEYQPLGFSIYYADEDYNAEHVGDTNGHQDGSNVGYARTSTNAYDITYEYNAKDDLIYKYPETDAFYHVNPTTVSREGMTIDLNTMDRHYVNTENTSDNQTTRAEKQSLDIHLNVTGPTEFTIENGILHAKFTNSADNWHRVEQYAQTVTVASLEATSPGADGQDRVITSDWAAIARVHQQHYTLADNDAYILHYETYPHIDRPEDTDCGMMDTQQYVWTEQHGSNTRYNHDIIHIYRQARWAILNEYTHLLPWNGSVNLDSCIEVHADHHYYNSGNRSFDFPVDIEKLGFRRKYTVVNYQYPASMGININGTEESQHAHLAVDANGDTRLVANFVKNGKRDVTRQSRSSIGREPLVMIELLDDMNPMTWNPDHMNWMKDSVQNNPRPNLVAVGFIKFKIADVSAPVLQGVSIEMQNSNMYASCAGDTVLTNWFEVEEQILDKLKLIYTDLSISKAEFESNYTLRGIAGEDYPFREQILLGNQNIIGQVYVPQTNKTQIIGTRQNWVNNVDYSLPSNWVLPQVVLNEDITEPGFVDPDRYGRIVYTHYDWLHRETNLIGVSFTAEEMLQQLVKRDHRGVYLDSLGNKVRFLSQADFYPYVDTKVAAKLVDPNHNGWPEVTLVFQVRVHLNKATMNRPYSRATIDGKKLDGNGNWYALDGSGDVKYINANIDAFKNGDPSTAPLTVPQYDVRRFIANLQQSLQGQKWLASTGCYANGTSIYTRAFDFIYNEITGERAVERIGIQRAKLGRLHGDLYFFTHNWLGDLEEGTPYWHDKNNTATIQDDMFYADKYLIKVCYTKNPLDTVVWAQEAAGKFHKGKLGKYLFAYKYLEDYDNVNKYSGNPKTGDPVDVAGGLVQNYSHYDMGHGELIAWIDNYDTHQVAFNPNMRYPYANFDIDGEYNENVNVHYNYQSRYAWDLLNRAGRYCEDQNSVQDGYSKATDNPFTACVHLNLFEGDCIYGINFYRSERPAGIDYIKWPDYTDAWALTKTDGHQLLPPYPYNNILETIDEVNGEYHNFYHRPEGVPVMLSNPDFLIRFERPLNVELATPWQTPSVGAIQDAEAGAAEITIHYAGMFPASGAYNPAQHGFFRNKTAIFPQDWRGYTSITAPIPYSTATNDWVEFYQGYNSGTFNLWNDHSASRPYNENGFMPMMGFSYMDVDRSAYNRLSNAKFFNWNGWYYLPNTNAQYARYWNEMTVVPQVDHMLTNYSGIEDFWSNYASQVNMKITHQVDPNTQNIVATTFRYLNDNINRGGFDILIPVTVKYAWGDLTTTGHWEPTYNLQKTNDRYFHNKNMLYVRVHFGRTVGN